MKVLLVLMILLSIVITIPLNGGDKGWYSLYGAEFTDAFYLIKTGRITVINLIEWIVLLIAHAGVVSLPFFTNKRFFKELLIFVPLFFVMLYAIWNLIIAFLLIPFLIVWIISLIVYFVNKKKTQLVL